MRVRKFCMLCGCPSFKTRLYEISVSLLYEISVPGEPSPCRYCSKCVSKAMEAILERVKSEARDAELKVHMLLEQLEVFKANLHHEERIHAAYVKAEEEEQENSTEFHKELCKIVKEKMRMDMERHMTRCSKTKKELEAAVQEYQVCVAAMKEFQSQNCNPDPNDATPADPSGADHQSQGRQSQNSPHNLRRSLQVHGIDGAPEHGSGDKMDGTGLFSPVDPEVNRTTAKALEKDDMMDPDLQWIVSGVRGHKGDLKDNADPKADEGMANGKQGAASKQRQEREFPAPAPGPVPPAPDSVLPAPCPVPPAPCPVPPAPGPVPPAPATGPTAGGGEQQRCGPIETERVFSASAPEPGNGERQRYGPMQIKREFSAPASATTPAAGENERQRCGPMQTKSHFPAPAPAPATAPPVGSGERQRCGLVQTKSGVGSGVDPPILWTPKQDETLNGRAPQASGHGESSSVPRGAVPQAFDKLSSVPAAGGGHGVQQAFGHGKPSSVPRGGHGVQHAFGHGKPSSAPRGGHGIQHAFGKPSLVLEGGRGEQQAFGKRSTISGSGAPQVFGKPGSVPRSAPQVFGKPSSVLGSGPPGAFGESSSVAAKKYGKQVCGKKRVVLSDHESDDDIPRKVRCHGNNMQLNRDCIYRKRLLLSDHESDDEAPPIEGSTGMKSIYEVLFQPQNELQNLACFNGPKAKKQGYPREKDWTREEEETLREIMTQHGVGDGKTRVKWKDILEAAVGSGKFKESRDLDIKKLSCKWFNMTKRIR